MLAGLNSRNLEWEDVRQWSRYFDWLLVLAKEDEAEIRTLLEKEKPVPYVTSWERMGEKKGYDRGQLEGTQRSIETILAARFGPDAHSLHEDIRKWGDGVKLEELLKQAATTASLDAFRAILG